MFGRVPGMARVRHIPSGGPKAPSFRYQSHGGCHPDIQTGHIEEVDASVVSVLELVTPFWIDSI